MDWISAELGHHPYYFSIFGSVLVGGAGILPMVILPAGTGDLAHNTQLKLLLAYAVGGLLGDVFLHLLPESLYFVAHQMGGKSAIETSSSVKIGVWVLMGILTFTFLQTIFKEEESSSKKCEHNNNAQHYREAAKSVINNKPIPSTIYCEKSSLNEQNGSGAYSRRSISSGGDSPSKEQLNAVGNRSNKDKVLPRTEVNKIDVSGYLNLMANSVDNFAHGLAIGGSFLVSFKVGTLTTFAILLHEIPHEIGDFAILLRAGFNRWDAAKAQLLTASTVLLGALTALSADSMDTLGERTSWILPFTAGGFLNIAMTNVLPELVQEKSRKQGLLQFACIVLGIVSMGALSVYC